MNELNQLRGQDEGNIHVSVRDQAFKENLGSSFLVISENADFNKLNLFSLLLALYNAFTSILEFCTNWSSTFMSRSIE